MRTPLYIAAILVAGLVLPASAVDIGSKKREKLPAKRSYNTSARLHAVEPQFRAVEEDPDARPGLFDSLFGGNERDPEMNPAAMVPTPAPPRKDKEKERTGRNWLNVNTEKHKGPGESGVDQEAQDESGWGWLADEAQRLRSEEELSAEQENERSGTEDEQIAQELLEERYLRGSEDKDTEDAATFKPVLEDQLSGLSSEKELNSWGDRFAVEEALANNNVAEAYNPYSQKDEFGGAGFDTSWGSDRAWDSNQDRQRSIMPQTEALLGGMAPSAGSGGSRPSFLQETMDKLVPSLSSGRIRGLDSARSGSRDAEPSGPSRYSTPSSYGQTATESSGSSFGFSSTPSFTPEAGSLELRSRPLVPNYGVDSLSRSPTGLKPLVP